MKTKLLPAFILVLITGIVCPVISIAQDIIIKKNAEEISSKVLEIDSINITYKKFDNIDGPSYILSKSEVFMIKYANGTKEIISALDNPKIPEQENKMINEKKFFHEEKSYVSLGYGLGTYLIWFNANNYYGEEISSSVIGPVYGKYEYGVTEDFSIGVNLAYVEYEVSYAYESYDYFNGNPAKYTETDNYRSFSGLLRANWHFGNSDKLDPYFGVGLGYRTATLKYTNNDPQQIPHYQNYYSYGLWGGSSHAFPLGFETTFGIRIRFSEQVGAFAEAGFAKSVVQAGLLIKF